MESNEEIKNHSLDEAIKWYTPIFWQNGSPKLPAVFLNKYKVLASIIGKNIEFKERYQYSIDFDAFKIDGKNIDDLFSEYNDELPPDAEMFKYCRFLYPDSKPLYIEPGNSKTEYADNSSDIRRQFRNEFRKFRNCFFSLRSEPPNSKSTENILAYDPKLDRSDLLKIFILYRSLRIRSVKKPLDYSRKSLPDKSEYDDGKLQPYDIDDIFLSNIAVHDYNDSQKKREDNSSIAPLFGCFNSPNGFFIEKLYAMLWYNGKWSESELKRVSKYIDDWECAAYRLQFKELEEHFSDNRHANASIHAENNFELHKRSIVELNNYICTMFKEELATLKNSSCSERIDDKLYTEKISLFGYFIIKLYIENRIRLCNIEADEDIDINDSSAMKESIDINLLNEIRNAVKNIQITNHEEFFQIFDCNTNVISPTMRKKILRFIYSGRDLSGSKKNIHLDKIASSIRTHYPDICVIYTQWLAFPGQFNLEDSCDRENCFHLIVASYLFYVCQRFEIKRAHAKRYNNKNFNMPPRTTSKNVFSQFRDNIDLENTNPAKNDDIFDAKEFNYYDLKTKLHLRRFYPLFYGRCPITKHDYQMTAGTMATELVKFWKEAMLNAYRLV